MRWVLAGWLLGGLSAAPQLAGAVAPPPAVLIGAPTLGADNGQVVLAWETLAGPSILGFSILRQDQPAGAYVRLNPTLLPYSPEAIEGGRCRFVDATGQPGREHRYKILVYLYGWDEQPYEYGPYAIQWPVGASARAAAEPFRFTVELPPPPPLPADSPLATARRAAASKAATLTGDKMKVALRNHGFYFVGADQIAAKLGKSRDVITNQIASRLLRLSTQGNKTAWIPAPTNSGVFIYQPPFFSPFTWDNIFWLEQGRGLVVPALTGAAPAEIFTDQYFEDTLHFKQFQTFDVVTFTDPRQDIWLWAGYLYAPRFTNLPFYLHGVAPVAATGSVCVHMWGANSTSPATTNHHVQFSLNGYPLGETFWVGKSSNTCYFSFPQSCLSNGNNTLTATLFLESGILASIVNIESFDITYARSYAAVGDQLVFRPDAYAALTVHGFTNQDIYVCDVTASSMPRQVAAINVQPEAGGYCVSMYPEAGRQYAAFTGLGAWAPSNTWAMQPTGLRSGTNTANYIMITHAALTGEVERLAQFRAGRGWRPLVVDLENIYNEFSWGVETPYAIQNFLAYMWQYWPAPPELVLLAGNGNLDYKNYLGYGRCVVPGVMVHTSYGIYYSDNIMADADSDNVPEYGIGRLPAYTLAALSNLVTRVINYENEPSGPWSSNVLLVADNPDEAGNFTATSESVVPYIPASYRLARGYLEYATLAATRAVLFSNLNSGAVLFNYVGHGATTRLATEGIMTTADIPALTNASRGSVLLGMTCSINRIDHPSATALGAELLRGAKGGTIGTWAPIGQSFNSLAEIIDQLFMQYRFVDGRTVLGDIVRRTLDDYITQGNDPLEVEMFMLLGDPGLVLK